MQTTDDGAWYALTMVWTASEKSMYMYLSDDPMTGSDPLAVLRRHRLALERELALRHGLDTRDQRSGSMYAVWRFEKRIPKSEAKDEMRRTSPWRIFVITGGGSWADSVAELCLPPGVSLFRHGE